MRDRPPLYSITLLSASALAFEILLVRLFSIIQWYHFAYMIIGLALLGYGMSGTFVALTKGILKPKFEFFYILFLLFFGLTVLGSFRLAQYLPFNGEELFWDPNEIFLLMALFLILSVPFFMAACCICLCLLTYKEKVSAIYGCDLLGAGVGSIVCVTCLFFVSPLQLLSVITYCAIAAACIAIFELRIRGKLIIAACILISCVVATTAIQPEHLQISPYKSLSQYLRIKGTQVISEKSSPLGLITLVASEDIPFRHVPGLSLNNSLEPLPQIGMFIDGDNLSVITAEPDNDDQLRYLDFQSSALPYNLSKPKRVAILGGGGGTDILQAQYHNVAHIDAVEINPQIIILLQEEYSEYTGDRFNDKAVTFHNSEIRAFIQQTEKKFDLIQLALIDAFSPSASGLYALHENYLYTVEALQEYLTKLTPQGYLAITRWIKNPPRDTLKILATATEALARNGVEQPQLHLNLIRSWQTSTLVIKNSPFNREEIATTRHFCDTRSFDISFNHLADEKQTNRYNIMDEPIFHRAALAITSETPSQFIKGYKFNIAPAYDDRPYFHHFFRWASFFEILKLKEKGGLPLLEAGYLLLVATFLISCLLSFLLIFFPLILKKRQPSSSSNISKTSVGCYFSLIGIGFLAVEMAFIQRFIQFLHHPIYSVTVTISTFLLFAGMGSLLAGRITAEMDRKRFQLMTVLGIVAIALIYLLSLDKIFFLTTTQPMIMKIILSVILLSPIALLMGMPFPMALTVVAQQDETLTPWAWAVNGSTSVIAASLASLLAIHSGFTGVILFALLLYLLSNIFFPK